MSSSNVFQTGFLRVSARDGEEAFLSVTPGFERGPGIERDGLTLPRMADPHTIQRVMVEKKLYTSDFTPPQAFTTDAWVQRAGTWTLFNHLHEFLRHHKTTHTVIGIQSCGDLTMNPWHVALVHQRGRPELCFLKSEHRDGIVEPLSERRYRCLVTWKPQKGPCSYEFIDLQFSEIGEGYSAHIVDELYLSAYGKDIKALGIDHRNIAPHIDFALSGKPIVERGTDLSMANAVDRFQDVRHIFNVPDVAASGAIGAHPIDKINFGEHVLYTDLNARRAALNSAILVDLKVKNTEVDWEELRKFLVSKKHYREVKESPTRRGEFRRYSADTVEIFYPHNVYPFGVLGGTRGELVCLSSGGLSGRVGNTLEGITRVAYDFFGCQDAMVLDEGFDTFHLVNPVVDPDGENKALALDNDALLKQAAAFTKWRARLDHQESIKRHKDHPDVPTQAEVYHKAMVTDGGAPRFENWPLNQRVFEELDKYCKENGVDPAPPRELQAFAVPPLRSQMRAVVIFAVRNGQKK